MSQNTIHESIQYHSLSTAGNKLRVSGLSENEPLFQLRNSVMMGEWKNLVGTEVAVDENGDFVGSVDGWIVAKHGRLVQKESEDRPLVSRALERARELSQRKEETDSDKDKDKDKTEKNKK
ncbi:hypothetical protein DAMA08_034570 [Martiniozyma asiatica (nom. inval.)]|nr:hypothetical protein DAMA08_034570 [Martiniozyma asiatica]